MPMQEWALGGAVVLSGAVLALAVRGVLALRAQGAARARGAERPAGGPAAGAADPPAPLPAADEARMTRDLLAWRAAALQVARGHDRLSLVLPLRTPEGLLLALELHSLPGRRAWMTLEARAAEGSLAAQRAARDAQYIGLAAPRCVTRLAQHGGLPAPLWGTASEHSGRWRWTAALPGAWQHATGAARGPAHEVVR